MLLSFEMIPAIVSLLNAFIAAGFIYWAYRFWLAHQQGQNGVTAGMIWLCLTVALDKLATVMIYWNLAAPGIQSEADVSLFINWLRAPAAISGAITLVILWRKVKRDAKRS